MKALILFFSLWIPVIAVEPDSQFYKDKEIYSAIVRGTTISVYMSTEGFDPAKHKIVPYPGVNEGRKSPGIYGTVNGHDRAGIDGPLPLAEDEIPHLSRLAVSFGDTVVEAPKDLIAHVFDPHHSMTFDARNQDGRVSVSSDAKAVIVELGVGDGAGAATVAFTFTSSGKCVPGLPRPVEP